MKKIISFTLILFITLPLLAITPQNKRIYILATGGTIAGTAKSSTQASYQPAVISVDQMISSVKEIGEIAQLTGIQVCNISSQNMELSIWLKLYNIVDSLFTNNICDGVVITHGTDTMEETAYFLNLTVRHSKPIVLTGSMRPSTSLSADGPLNLFNAVSLASSPISLYKGVMVLMNDYILSADDVTKTNSVNSAAFTCPNYGPLGYMRDGQPIFYRETLHKHTITSDFDIRGLNSLPQVEIVYSYAFSSAIPIKALIDANVGGIVIAGVGHGNYNKDIEAELDNGYRKGVEIVRSTRVTTGGVDTAAEGYDPKWPVCFLKSPQKARILLMLALTLPQNNLTNKTERSKLIQKIFMEY